jgi:5-methyltetrahydrofolate--homocysteine methyltransferase
MTREAEILDELYEVTIDGVAQSVLALTEEGLELGMPPHTLLFDSLIPGLEEVGRLFEVGDYFVPEMLISAKAMQGAMSILKPLIAATGVKPIATFVMGTVQGDIHDIGKNLCNIMLEGAGLEVIDLGVNVPPERFVEAVKEHRPQAVGFSAFLTTTMPMIPTSIETLKQAGLRDDLKIFVGGAPVNQAYCDRVGADGYAPDASSLVRLTKQLLELN